VTEKIRPLARSKAHILVKLDLANRPTSIVRRDELPRAVHTVRSIMPIGKPVASKAGCMTIPPSPVTTSEISEVRHHVGAEDATGAISDGADAGTADFVVWRCSPPRVYRDLWEVSAVKTSRQDPKIIAIRRAGCNTRS